MIALTQPRATDSLIEHLSKSYRDKFRVTPTSFVTTATAGAKIIE
jgi:hypothetical protein